MNRSNKGIIVPRNKRFDFKTDNLRGILENVKIEWTKKETRMINRIKREKEKKRKMKQK